MSFDHYIRKPKNRFIILRHDVDKLPGNSLKTAKIENKLEINGTYYFRSVKESYDEKLIKQIADLGHEVGYHYENLSTCGGDLRLAIEDFRLNLEKFRKIYPVKTICMHGSPLSKWDNRDLWKVYDYRDYGIIGEPYFDIDWDEVFYLTDTGRRWDGDSVSIRDKVQQSEISKSFGISNIEYGVSSREYRVKRDKKVGSKEYKVSSKFSDFNFHSTFDIIEAVESGNFPDKAMITIHPQRWTNNPVLWTKELVWQNVKNVVKKAILKRRKGERAKERRGEAVTWRIL